MIKIELPNYTVELYDSIKDIPAERDTLMNYYLLEDSGIGSDLQSIESHLSHIIDAINTDKKDHVRDAIYNFRASCYSMITRYRPDQIAWACMIKTVNGESLTDFSAESLQRLVKQLSDDGLTAGKIEDTFEEIKKKLPTNWETSSRTG